MRKNPHSSDVAWQRRCTAPNRRSSHRVSLYGDDIRSFRIGWPDPLAAFSQAELSHPFHPFPVDDKPHPLEVLRGIHTLRICPAILRCTGNINGSRSDQNNQLVLVDRTIPFVLVVKRVVIAEPMGKRGVDAADGLSIALRLGRRPIELLLITNLNRSSLAPAQSDVFRVWNVEDCHTVSINLVVLL